MRGMSREGAGDAGEELAPFAIDTCQPTIKTMFVIVAMRMWADVHRHVSNMAMAHAALCDDVIRKGLHLCTPAFEHGHFKTAVVVEVDVKRRLRKAVMGMEVLRQTLGQLPCRMVVDIAQCRKAIAIVYHFEA